MLLLEGWQTHYALPHEAVAGAILLSGVYDLQPLVGTYIDAALQLTATDVATFSPIRAKLGPPVKTIVAWGEK